MTRILVTGATGFLGRPLVAALLAAGHEVHAVARHGAGSPAQVHRADLLHPGSAARLVGAVRPDTLVHLAWCTEPGSYRDSAENLVWAEATLRLLREFAAAGGRRAVLAGTVLEYDPDAAVCVEEETPLRPRTLYGVTKASLGTLSHALADAHGLSLAWARLFWLYGPHEQPGRLVSSLAAGLLAGRSVALGPGTERRDYLHVADAAAALAALAAGDVRGDVNIGSGTSVAVADLARRLGELLGRPELVALGARPAGRETAPLVRADVARLRDEVGVWPALDLESGLRDTAQWWRAMSAGERQLAGVAT